MVLFLKPRYRDNGGECEHKIFSVSAITDNSNEFDISVINTIY